MAGPGEVRSGIALSPEDELLWLTGYEATMVDPSSERQLSQEFMCHNSLFLDSRLEDYRSLLGTRPYGSPRVFTLAQGAYRIDFPAGFAIPFPARQGLQLQSQVLNLSPEHVGQVVRHRVRAEFVADSDLWTRPRPLFLVEATGRVLLRDPGAKALPKEVAARGKTRTDSSGRVWTGHWQVPPGPHTNLTRVEEELKLPFDTTAHYITSHLHPYAQWQELRDLTDGSVVYRVQPRASQDGRTLIEIPAYSSPNGLPLFADHDYQLVTHYLNTTAEPITAMSIMFLYCLDKEFQGYTPTGMAPSGSAPLPLQELDDFCAGQEEGAP